MKFLQVSKRILLFVLVNILVLVTISLVLRLFGLDRYLESARLNYTALAAFCLLWGMGGAFISLAISRWMAKFAMGVKVIDPNTSNPALRELVENVHALARRAQLPKLPEVGIYESPEVNAFATGPSKARSLVAVSTGLLNRMDRDEVQGVLAHEVAHIANGDMVTMTLIQGVINAFVMFFARILAFAVAQALRSRDDDRGGFWIQYLLVMVFEIALSLLGAIVVCWFSRQREFRADAGGRILAGKPQMIGALRALQSVLAGPHAVDERGASLQSLKISGKPAGFLALFATHPPLEQRIAALERLP
jgi:heat shock protein HtpX